jgi:hypothetical protein
MEMRTRDSYKRRDSHRIKGQNLPVIDYFRSKSTEDRDEDTLKFEKAIDEITLINQRLETDISHSIHQTTLKQSPYHLLPRLDSHKPTESI